MSVEPGVNPFPGLRPFREDEAHLFFGRESQVDAMVDKLAATRFLAVVGASGCGKSSLVNCGLRPALHRGLMTSAGSAWRMVQFRPGGNPIRSLARALARRGALFGNEVDPGNLPLDDIVETTLRMSKLGLIDIVEQARLDAGVKVLVVVDQFEELFRYRQLRSPHAQNDSPTSEDALALVNLLLEVPEHPDCAIYVVLTMRSDFLGDCTHFPGLAEAINAAQFLVPRLTRDERRAAIAGPAGVGGGRISPVLLTRLVNDVGDNPDQLSILQHALNRTWARWERDGDPARPVELEHYESVGTMARALDQHAERAYAELADGRPRQICEKVFKALTDKAADPRGVRRPTRMATLCELAACSEAELLEVIDVFRKASRSFLMPPAGESVAPDSVIDISHESLMRVWQRLATWADEEAQAAVSYRRLAETAGLHAAGQASLWRDPELQLALDWWERNGRNQRWADQYHPGFATAMAFLDRSREAREAERQAGEAQRRRELQIEKEQAAARAQAASARIMRWAAAVSLLLAAAAMTFAIVAFQKNAEAAARSIEAIEARERAKAEADRATRALADFQQARVVLERETEQARRLERAAETNPSLAQALGGSRKPTVYVHVHSPAQRADARRLGNLLPPNGYDAPGIETVDAGPQRTQLRYFRESDRTDALAATAVLKKLLRSGAIATQFVGGYEAQSRPGQFELWYGFPWFVIAGTFGNGDDAKGTLEKLSAAGFDASAIDTNDFPNLADGFVAVVLGPYRTQAEAEASNREVRDLVPDAYVKSGW